MSPRAESEQQWTPNGFPPPSFVVGTVGSGRRGLAEPRNRWLAAAAILGALLLLAGALLIAAEDDQTALQSGSSSTTLADPAATTPTSAFDPAAGLTEATFPPGGVIGPTVPAPGANPGGAGTGGTTTSGAAARTGTTGAAARAPTPGRPAPAKLAVPTDTLAIPRIDTTVGGSQSAKLTLRNTGGVALDFTTRTSVDALRVDPASGSIAPGAAREVTVTLDGNRTAEGNFTGQLTIGGSGGDRQVGVTGFVGEAPTVHGATTSGSPCTGQWRFSVVVVDRSRLKSVRAAIDGGPFDIVLKNEGATTGPSGVWTSDERPQVAATFAFTIQAIDDFDQVNTGEGSVSCP